MHRDLLCKCIRGTRLRGVNGAQDMEDGVEARRSILLGHMVSHEYVDEDEEVRSTAVEPISIDFD